jgi:transcriptional regulator with XRE-family HTH domain
MPEILGTMNTTAQRLNALMDQRRLELGLRWKAIAERAKITHQTLLQLRKGAEVSDLTVANVERALDWGPGSIRSILSGGDPTPLTAAEGAVPLSASTEWWDGEIIGPETPLHDGEILRWRDEPGRRTYELSEGGLSFEETLGAEEEPADVIDELRGRFARRVALVNAALVERTHAEGRN